MYACMYVYAGCGLGFRDTTCRYNYMIICSLFWDQSCVKKTTTNMSYIYIYVYVCISISKYAFVFIIYIYIYTYRYIIK